MRCILCNETSPTCQCPNPQWASEHPWSPAYALPKVTPPAIDTFTSAPLTDVSLVHSGREKLTC